MGATQTSSVQTSISTGKAISVLVSPNRLITMPVPNSENRKEIVLVVCVVRNDNESDESIGAKVETADHKQSRCSTCHSAAVALTCPKYPMKEAKARSPACGSSGYMAVYRSLASTFIM